MIKHKADVNVQNQLGETPLMAASVQGHEEVVKILLQSEANVGLRDRDGHTALTGAAERNHENIIRLLIQAGPMWM